MVSSFFSARYLSSFQSILPCKTSRLLSLARQTFLALVFFLTVSLVCEPALAQDVVVPLDEQMKLKLITQDIEEECHLFPEVKDFKEARLYMTGDSSYSLEILTGPDEMTSRTQLPMNQEEVDAFRRRVTKTVCDKAPEVFVDQSGRSRFLWATTLLSIGWYGWAFPAMMNVDDASAALGLYFLTSGGGFLLPYALTSHSPVTEATADLAIWGGTRGLVHGAIVYDLANDDYGGDGTGLIATMTLFSIGEMGICYAIAAGNNMEQGQANAIGLGGDFGMGLGIGIIGMASDFEDEGWEAGAIVGAALGIPAGSALYNAYHYSPGGVMMMYGSGLGGAATLGTIAAIAEIDDDQAATGMVCAGAVGGLFLGHALVKNKDFPKSAGEITVLGQIGGGLMGFGLGFLIAGDDNEGWKTVLALGTAGSWVGYALLYAHYNETVKLRDKLGLDLRLETAPMRLNGLTALKDNRTYAAVPSLRLSVGF